MKPICHVQNEAAVTLNAITSGTSPINVLTDLTMALYNVLED